MTDRSKPLFVVPAERHVERLAREGKRAETRASLQARLAATLLAGARFADVREVRLTLAVALEEAAQSGQLSLFGGAGAGDDPLLAALRGRGGASWVRAVAAIDDAIGALRSRGATAAHLERVRGAGVAPARARTLGAAMRALDGALGRAGARDGRLLGAELAQAIRDAGASVIADAISARHVRTRWLLAWDPDDLVWWRALDETLARDNGSARVLLPSFDKRLESARDRDPLEVIADVVARHLDAAPETETIAPVLGDLATIPPADAATGARVDAATGARVDAAAGARVDATAGARVDATTGARVRLVRARDARDQAQVAASLVAAALSEGACVERVVIAYPVRDERTLLPLRRALHDEGVVFYDALGPPPSSVPVIAAALHALAAAESRDRVAVARLLRGGYVDATRVLRGAPEPSAHEDDEPRDSAHRDRESAHRDRDSERSDRDSERSDRESERSETIDRLARALETHATAEGKDASARLVATAAAAERARDRAGARGGDPGREGETTVAARRVAVILDRASAATTRGDRVRAARVLFDELGFAARASGGALATFASDEAPSGVDRVERMAVARDVRAWEMLEGALDAYETAALRTGTRDRPIDGEVFRLELAELLDSSGRLPGAGRAGAVRVARLADVAGDELDLLVVLDANDGSLPRDTPPITLVSESLEGAIARVAQGSFASVAPGELAARDLAALAMSAAETARVVFVTTTDDASDTPARPARIFTALERAGVPIEEAKGARDASARTRPPTSERAGTGAREASARTRARPASERAGRASREDLDESRRSRRNGALGAEPQEIARRATRERVREGFFLDPTRPQSDIVGALDASETIRSVVGAETGDTPERALAVTSIERFAQCPFKGYAHVVLAAREGEEQHELPDAREEGNLGHSALAAAFAAAGDEWKRRPRDAAAIVARGLAAADVALAAASGGHAPLRAVVRLRVRESVRVVIGRAIADETWDFLHAEQGFGHRRPWPALDVSARGDRATTGTKLWLRGSIDRVDRAHDGAGVRVVDYKRSKSTVRDASSSLGEVALQIPLYAVVASRALGVPSTGAYHPMQPRDLASDARPRSSAARSSPEDRVSELARRAPDEPSEIERRVLEIAASARAGRFAPLPARESECTYCSVSGGCRKPRFAMAPADEIDDPSGAPKETA